MKPAESLSYFQGLQPFMMEQLLRYVQRESPTPDKDSVDSFGEEVASDLARTEMSVEVDQQPQKGNHLIARWNGNGPKILLLGHLDTVWELGTFEKMPIRVEGDIAYGPGIFDMKGGIVIAMTVLGALREHRVHQGNVTFLLNSDEEEGSNTSRSLIEREAEGANLALVFEPAGPGNGIKTKRKGVGQYEISVFGKAAHAGVEPEKGVSAVEELATQILEIQSWNRQRTGVTVNAGVIHGGTRSNVIPAEAKAVVDVRVDSPEDEAWIQQRFQQLKVHNPQAKMQVEGGINRSPLVRSEQVIALYEELSEIGSQFGYPVREFWTGGASDGNLTSAMGIPTLDGLGAEGDGAHALHEQIIVSSLAKRANLLYHFLRKKIKPS